MSQSYLLASPLLAFGKRVISSAVGWTVTAIPWSESFKTTHGDFLCSHTNYLHSLFLSSSVFYGVTQRWLLVTDVSGQLIGPTFQGQEVLLNSSGLSVFRVLADSMVPLPCPFRQLYQPLRCTVMETRSAMLVCHVVVLHRLCPDATAPTHQWDTLPLSVDPCSSLRLSSFLLLTMQCDIQQNTCIFQPVSASSLRRRAITLDSVVSAARVITAKTPSFSRDATTHTLHVDSETVDFYFRVTAVPSQFAERS
jgi:hypothetical protein